MDFSKLVNAYKHIVKTASKTAGLSALSGAVAGIPKALLAVSIARRIGTMIVGDPSRDPFDPLKHRRV